MASSSASSEATFTSGTPPPPPPEAAVSAAAVTVEENNRDIPVAYKTKTIQFLGRTTPIILQNDNGPCPLLAICNVLLLKNQLKESSDIPEISQDKLLQLVAEQLLDSNSNISNKDAGYAENQRQNISDAIDLLPRLATGIDVNIKFTRIDDFEFTRECAIFDLLDIPLYHGWIVDPQDHNTAIAIGSKSYNTLVEELVALDARDTEPVSEDKSEEECVDFAAATTATLGVPSPCFSRGRSFDESPIIDPNSPILKKGDITEGSEVSTSSKYNAVSESEPVSLVETLEQRGGTERQNHCFQGPSTSDNSIDLINPNIEGKGAETILQGGASSSEGPEQGSPLVQSSSGEPSYQVVVQETSVLALDNKAIVSRESGLSAGEDDRQTAENYGDDQKQAAPTSEIFTSENNPVQRQNLENSNLPVTPDTTSTTKSHNKCETEGIVPSVVESEPIYEGEENIIASDTVVNQSRESMYEGEVILAEQCVTGSKEDCDGKKEELTPEEGALIRNFLKNNATQLTIYGLFRLRDDLKERELCVFFRNNHFNTMFKFEGDLYILATDHGFMNEPGLVWEKLNEVNGDTMYMTYDFKEFNGEDHNNTAWEFLANSAEEANYDYDLKLAKDLQQQEFDQNPPQPKVAAAGNRFTVGPQNPHVVDDPDETLDEDDIDLDEDDIDLPKAEDEEEPEIIESDIEIDVVEPYNDLDTDIEIDVVEPDNDPPQQIGGPSVEFVDCLDASHELKARGMVALSEGKLKEAIKLLTKAITFNPTSAIIYGSRASVYIEMKKPKLAIRDASAAVEINPCSAKGYKFRGIARAMLGEWVEAANDLHAASRLDHDEDIDAALKKVEPNARKIVEHSRKYERLHKERDARKIEREKRKVETNARKIEERARKCERLRKEMDARKIEREQQQAASRRAIKNEKAKKSAALFRAVKDNPTDFNVNMSSILTGINNQEKKPKCKRNRHRKRQTSTHPHEENPGIQLTEKPGVDAAPSTQDENRPPSSSGDEGMTNPSTFGVDAGQPGVVRPPSPQQPHYTFCTRPREPEACGNKYEVWTNHILVDMTEASLHEVFGLTIGTPLYSPTNTKYSRGKILAYEQGIYKSITRTQMGISLNIDTTSRVRTCRCKVINFVTFLLRTSLRIQLTALSKGEHVTVEKALRGLMVRVVAQPCKMFRVSGLGAPSPAGTSNSLLPMVECLDDNQTRLCLPMEDCEILEDQNYYVKMNDIQKMDFMRSTCLNPQECGTEIHKHFQTLLLEAKKKGFSNVINNMAMPAARVLPFPKVYYMIRKPFRSNDGQLLEKYKKMFDSSGYVRNWIVVNFTSDICDEGALQFSTDLAQTCVLSGMKFNTEPVMHAKRALPDSAKKCMDYIYKQLEDHLPDKTVLDLVIFILPDNNGSLYGDLKFICETDLGVVSQCCLAKHVKGTSGVKRDTYITNLSWKINMKFGGHNTSMANPIYDEYTMVIGADVIHPCHPCDDSIAAVVASDSKHFTRYPGCVAAQASKEIIEDLNKMIKDIIKSFYEKHAGRLPARILFYRGGVSDENKQQVLNSELRAIYDACKCFETRDDEDAKVTYVVVQNRHHTRFFHDDMCTTNVDLGVVVDSGICHPTEFDFYIHSHSSVQGATRPTYYHVLHDDNEFTSDGLQSLTYSLCYACGRWETLPLSVAAPVFYANRLAQRGMLYAQRRGSNVGTFPALNDKLKDFMFYC